jgi:hypothetical protein
MRLDTQVAATWARSQAAATAGDTPLAARLAAQAQGLGEAGETLRLIAAMQRALAATTQEAGGSARRGPLPPGGRPGPA